MNNGKLTFSGQFVFHLPSFVRIGNVMTRSVNACRGIAASSTRFCVPSINRWVRGGSSGSLNASATSTSSRACKFRITGCRLCQPRTLGPVTASATLAPLPLAFVASTNGGGTLPMNRVLAVGIVSAESGEQRS